MYFSPFYVVLLCSGSTLYIFGTEISSFFHIVSDETFVDWYAWHFKTYFQIIIKFSIECKRFGWWNDLVASISLFASVSSIEDVNRQDKRIKLHQIFTIQNTERVVSNGNWRRREKKTK